MCSRSASLRVTAWLASRATADANGMSGGNSARAGWSSGSREDHGALEDVFELAHIAGPVIGRQCGHRQGGMVSMRLILIEALSRAEHRIPFVLGHALYMKAIHGGKAKNDKIDAHKIAVLLRGGMLPQASVYPAEMRATRDLLRRRMHLARTRGELLAHGQHTNSQYNLPAIGKKIAYKTNRDGVAERCADPAVQKSIDVDLALIGSYDELLRDVELTLVNTAKHHDANTLYLLQTVPGIGKILSLVLLYEIHQIDRFPRGQDVRFVWSSGEVCQGIRRQTLRDVRDENRPCPSHVGVLRSRRLMLAGSSCRSEISGQIGEKT